MTSLDDQYDVVVLGAGAAGLMCAIEAGKRGRRVLLLDHAEKPAEKIRISGGGRCNFTNVNAKPQTFISQNPHFCMSALKRYTPKDFIALVERYYIAYHEKTLGQLFCDDSSKDIIHMLINESREANVELLTGTGVHGIRKTEAGFVVTLPSRTVQCESLVIATGGPSIPKMGASSFGYDVAKMFDHPIIQPRPALVPLTFDEGLLARTAPLSGLSVDPILVTAACGKSFREALLFTHRGLSGPAILQISSYWREGQEIAINLLPDLKVFDVLKVARQKTPKQWINSILAQYLPKRLADFMAENAGFDQMRIADMSDDKLKTISAMVQHWTVKPQGSEGYRTAEVTLGGLDTTFLSSKTMESNHVKGLYFIGEVVDVTGHLGGYNFQWAWSSGWVAGKVA